MFVRFDIDKCMEAAGALFSTTEAGTLSRVRILKLLYLANRKSLEETGEPIVDDDVLAMDNGPVLRYTWDLMRDSDRADPGARAAWDAHFKVVDQIQIRMVKDPGTDQLSDYDVDTLVETAREYAGLDDFELSELTHTFEEWKRAREENRTEIAPVDLLMAIGYTPEEIQASLAEAQWYARERALLGCR
jgi:uncharacterized phage-associated protein